MSEEWKKLWITIGIALTAGVARNVTSGERRTFGQFVQGLFLAGFVGAMTALALQQTSFSEPFKGFVIGLASFAGEDVLMGVLKLSRDFGLHPADALRRLRRFLR